MWNIFKKDGQMMLTGKFFLVAFGSLILYTLFINFGYINYMNAELYNVYPKTGKFTGVGIFTIVEEKDGWGRLKAYAEKRDGWISLAFTTRM